MSSPLYERYLRLQKRRQRLVLLSRLAVLVAFLGIWEFAARWGWIDPMLTSRPSLLASSFRELAFEGNLLRHTWITGWETLVGIVISMALGTGIAVGFWWSTFASKVLEPYVVVLNALPKVALGPIFYIWLGDRYSIYGMAVAISIIVTIIMVESGFREISKTKLKLMESFGATRGQMLRMVLLPASIPYFIATLKVNVGLTLVGVVMGEFLSSKAGLGYLIIYGGQVFQMTLVMVSIAMLALLSALLYGAVNVLELLARRRYHHEG
ncbi:sulfonate ABC transporter permease [Cohnella sp. CIP 111063]|jgi:NitT/TauT family transport system permease protein|uniref:ABC transporter permease n=1 Tax=unclassified Cohnella TaxID=2636738 RepID=UPI000B8C5878|nr:MULTISPECIES: ABC transporter permease [unclassified Cohnella]OXS56227.1 sulfonate ABC transporter permease [Cohnella sp. CIP 111063]PRX67864.1 NitT/TauT family transport system permease protein [Cohnella sp. SGD-V74]